VRVAKLCRGENPSPAPPMFVESQPKCGDFESVGRGGVVLKTGEKRREKVGRNRSRGAYLAWAWSDRLQGRRCGGDAQIRLETGGDACFGRGDAFVAVSGGEKVHHGNLVERALTGAEILKNWRCVTFGNHSLLRLSKSPQPRLSRPISLL
jgi:hypothetical protein